MRILVVDDEPLARNELSYLLYEYDSDLIIDQADSIETALIQLLQKVYQVVFLDIHLSEESGITLAKAVNKMTHPPMIIFATAYDQYAIEAFGLNARDYLLKPYDVKRLAQAMDKVKTSERTTTKKPYPQLHPIEDDDRIYMVPTEQIIMIEAQQGEILVHTQDRVYHDQSTLVYWEHKLDAKHFMRIHRAFIVNLQKIVTIEPWFNQTLQITLENQAKAQVSRSRVKEFKEYVGLR